MTRSGAGPAPTRGPRTYALRGSGVMVVVDVPVQGQPAIAYWGPNLGDLSEPDLAAAVAQWRPAVAASGLDEPMRIGLLPAPLHGYRLTPGLSGFRRGVEVPIDLRTCSCVVREADDRTAMEIVMADDVAGLAVRTDLDLDRYGTLRARHTVTNTRDDPFELVATNIVLPLPARATEIADFTGRWSGERSEQRLPLRFGSWLRESRRGRPGAASPYVTSVGTPGFAHRRGEVWAVHVAWSGNQAVRVEADPDGTRVVTAGELLEPGEISLGRGESYRTPWVYAVYAGTGGDGVTRRFHATIRARKAHPTTPRPVTLNTWEAVYFDQDPAALVALAETAARLGVERFVLDDGWFGGRRDDTRGLGDWVESADVWPDGLDPLVDRVHELGMQFGLWVEPEMVNLDSDLYRAHPDWLLAAPGRLPPPARHQYILDVALPEAADYLFTRLDRLVKRYRIAYLKWDHNRDAIGAVHAGRAGVHAQTLAVYALLDRLRAANPGLEIESCASGGSRVDLGILERTERVWASDCNDALEREWIQAGTRALLPLELIGAHVGPPRSHTTSRIQDLGFRAATALFGSFGLEWDIAAASVDERRQLAAVIAAYQRLRPLLHQGVLVNVDHPDPAALLYGVVSDDRRQAVFCYAQLATSRFETPVPAVFPGLDPALDYTVRLVEPAGPPRTRQRSDPPWVPRARRGSLTAPGVVLSLGGLPVPILEPEQAMVVELTAD